MKHKRPHKHLRTSKKGKKFVVNPSVPKKIKIVRFRLGYDKNGNLVPVNPVEKEITNKEYKDIMKVMSPLADADKDGVRNIDDCRPFNKKRQDERQERALFGTDISEQTKGEFYKDVTAINKPAPPRESVRYGDLEELKRKIAERQAQRKEED